MASCHCQAEARKIPAFSSNCGEFPSGAETLAQNISFSCRNFQFTYFLGIIFWGVNQWIYVAVNLFGGESLCQGFFFVSAPMAATRSCAGVQRPIMTQMEGPMGIRKHRRQVAAWMVPICLVVLLGIGAADAATVAALGASNRAASTPAASGSSWWTMPGSAASRISPTASI
jgi:hypothetical protein